jgi:putative transposase
MTTQYGWHSRGYLPHLNAGDMLQHITFHLADSLPAKALERIRWELELLPESDRTIARRRRMHELLDAGRGDCALANPACAELVERSLLHGDGDRYRLLAWVVMPNHVHVLIETHAEWPVSKLVQSWKRHTARRIHQLLASAPDPFWQREYWDRYVRGEDHLAITQDYIEQNPVKAGLVAEAAQWRFGSARLKAPI